jgi:hypothetical protein
MLALDADFNALDETGRVWLPDAAAIAPREGQLVLLSDGATEVEAQLAFDASRDVWVGIPQPRTARLLARGRR